MYGILRGVTDPRSLTSEDIDAILITGHDQYLACRLHQQLPYTELYLVPEEHLPRRVEFDGNDDNLDYLSCAQGYYADMRLNQYLTGTATSPELLHLRDRINRVLQGRPEPEV